ncbi:MAG: glycosyltransferase family 39 protein [Elusimicrobiota bacterium]
MSRNKTEALAVVVCCAVFLGLMRRVSPNVGIGLNEVIPATVAYGWIHKMPAMVTVPTLRLFDWRIPIMYNRFTGPWEIYAILPFVAAAGGTLLTLRLFTAVMSCLGIWGTYRLARLYFGDERAAFLSTLLLAVSPTLVVDSCWMVHGSAPGVAEAAWTLYFGALFVRDRKPSSAYLSCSVFFAGLCGTPWLAGLGVGLLLCFLLDPRRWLALLPEDRRERRRLIGGCLLCAAVFLLPIAAYNVSTCGEFFRFYASHLVHRAPGCDLGLGYSCSNIEYWTNMKIRLAHLAMLCDGNVVGGVRVGKPWHYAYAGPLLLSMLYAARLAWKRRSVLHAPVALWATFIGYMLVAPITPTNMLVGHLAPLAPILSILTLGGLKALRGRARGVLLAAVAVLCASQFAGDIPLLSGSNVDFGEWGFYEMSPTMIEACVWTGERPRTPIVSLSNAFSIAAPFFTQNRARLVPLIRLLNDDQSLMPLTPSSAAAVPWEKFLRRRDGALFVAENDSNGAKSLAEFKSRAAKLGVVLDRVKVFPDRQGRPAYEVYASAERRRRHHSEPKVANEKRRQRPIGAGPGMAIRNTGGVSFPARQARVGIVEIPDPRFFERRDEPRVIRVFGIEENIEPVAVKFGLEGVA